MLYKSGVEIIVTYQAANAETGLTIEMKVYDEAHAYDVAKSGDMTEIAGIGRYYKAYTPDAAGEWIITMAKKTTGGGEVVVAHRVATADEFGIKAAVETLGTAALATAAAMTTAQADLDNPDQYKADVAALALEATLTALKGAGWTDENLKTIDAIADAIKAKTDVIGASLPLAGEYDTQMGAVLLSPKSDQDTILAATGATGGIRGADSDSLKTLSDQIDAVSVPAMVG